MRLNRFIAILLTLCIAYSCKKKPEGTCLSTFNQDIDENLFATSASNDSVYFGGFLEILNKGGLKSYCDVLVMPHNLTSNNIVSVDKWSGFTISVARNCLNIFKQAGVNLLLYTPNILTRNSQWEESFQIKLDTLFGLPEEATTQAKDYLRLPIQSDYLDELAIQRSDFLFYFQHSDLGLERLYQYEQMKRQIFQTKSFYSFTNKTNNAFKMLDVGIKLNDSDIVFLNTQQANSCAPFSIDNDMQADFADNLPRYQKMFYQNHNQKSKSSSFNMSCFVYTDLVQFDASFVKSQETIDYLSSLTDFSDLTANKPITRNIKPSNTGDLSKSIAEAFEKWNNEILVKSAAIDVASLKIRNTDNNTTIQTFLTPTDKEIESIVSIAKNYWIKLAFTQSQKSVWNRKQSMSRASRWIRDTSRMFADHSTPFEDFNNKGNYHAYKNLSIAGNIANEDNKSIFANLTLNYDHGDFKVDHLLYFLLLGYTEPDGYPLDRFKTNSFLLYDGQPIAIYLSKNNEIVELVNNPSASIQNLDFWPGNLAQNIEPKLLEEDEITDNTTADRKIIDDGTIIKTTKRNNSKIKTEIISPYHELEDKNGQQTNCLISGLCAADIIDGSTKTKNDDGDSDNNNPCVYE